MTFTYLLLMLLVAAAVVTVLLMSRIHIEVDTSRVKKHDRFTVNIRALFGLFKYRVFVPMIDFRNLSDGIFIKKKTSFSAIANSDNAGELQVTRERIIEYYERARLLIKNVFDLTGWMKESLCHLECTQFRWLTRIGIGDAPETAITTGIVWGIKSSLLGFALPHIVMKTKPYVQVAPQYNLQHFSTELICKTQIRVYYAMLAGFRLLPRIWKGKGSLKSWQHILSKPRLKSTS